MILEEAERIYKKNNCSLFVMSREDMNNYILYRKLNVDRALERKWQLEVIEDLVKLLEQSGDSNLFNRIYDLSESFHDKKRLMLMMESIDKVKIEDTTISLCIAETIMGRKMLSIRDGMIFWAYDLGLKDEAITLIRRVLSLIDIQSDKKGDVERAERDLKRIRDIMDCLELNGEVILPPLDNTL